MAIHAHLPQPEITIEGMVWDGELSGTREVTMCFRDAVITLRDIKSGHTIKMLVEYGSVRGRALAHSPLEPIQAKELDDDRPATPRGLPDYSQEPQDHFAR